MQGILIKRHSRWLENVKGLYFKELETLKTPNYEMALMFYKGWILLIPTWSSDFPFSSTCESKYSFVQWNITSFTLWGSWVFKIRPSYDHSNLNSKSETQDPLTITVIHYLIITNQLISYSIEVCVSLRKEPSPGKSAAVVACTFRTNIRLLQASMFSWANALRHIEIGSQEYRLLTRNGLQHMCRPFPNSLVPFAVLLNKPYGTSGHLNIVLMKFVLPLDGLACRG